MKPSLLLLRVVTGLALATPSSAQAPLRSPQVPFKSLALQQFMDVDDPGIHVTTDQHDVPNWTSMVIGGVVSGVDLRATNGDAVGLYNTDDANSTLFELLPAGARAGWYATIDFNYQTGLLTTARFDEFSNLLGISYYNGAHQNHYGF